MRSLLLLIVPLCACSPKTAGGDDSAADLAPRVVDLATCAAPAGNRVQNPSFEAGAGVASNTGMATSTITGWDGCCNLDGQGLTTTWRVGPGDARCGAQALSIASAGARGDVLNQTLTPVDGAGRAFGASAWALVKTADPGASLTVDVFDLLGSRVLATAPPLTAAAAEWRPLVLDGLLPAGAQPRVQIRIYSKGNVSALVDDVSLILR